MRIRENTKGFAISKLVLLVLLVLLLAGGGWHVYKNNHKSTSNTKNSTTSTESAWATYKNQKYGVQFSYLKSWGQPNITDNSPPTVQKGHDYLIGFSSGADLSNLKTNAVIISADAISDGFSYQTCDSQGVCISHNVNSKESIDKVLKGDTKNLSYYSTDSYANVNSGSTPDKINKLSFMLVEKKLVIKPFNSSAIEVNYQLYSLNATCPAKGFAALGTNGCVTKDDLNLVNQFLNSFKPL